MRVGAVTTGERFEGAMLLALKMEGGAVAWQSEGASRRWRRGGGAA